MTFNIGDKVKIKENISKSLQSDITIPMLDYAGKEAIITEIYYPHEYQSGIFYGLNIDNGDWLWSEEVLKK